MKALQAAFITCLLIGVYVLWPLVLGGAVIAVIFWFVYEALKESKKEP